MADLQDKIVLITGATSGIGEVTATDLAKRGAHVVLLARNADKAAAAQATISAAAGHAHVDVLLADLADLDQVRRAAAEFNARYPHLDILVNNAGLLGPGQRQLTPQGLELTVATNHLGPFLLTALLFDKIRQSPAARIINVSSAGYRLAKPDLADLQQAQGYSPGRMYCNTKLYNILFTQELARRLRAHDIQNVVTNALHPGVVASNFGQNSGGWMAVAAQLARPFSITSEQGAETSIFLVTDSAMGQSSGGYYVKKKPEAVKHSFNTRTNARELWQLSEELTETKFLD
jgi:NAD(P)-dependent dehydrogenase (short-subunit alcohol dehydrogenase family)